MITVEVMGGLGNQLFQIFALISYSITYKVSFYIENKTIQNGPRKKVYWDNILQKLKIFFKRSLLNTPVVREPHFHYAQLPIVPSNINVKLSGYFQSYKYFDHNRETILKLLTMNEMKREIKNKTMQTTYENTVSMHFRVGDYKDIPQHHPLMSIEYYANALHSLIKDTNKDDWNILYYCEDGDIEYVNDKIRQLQSIQELKELSFVKIDSQLDDWEQMLTMALCKHNVIANSTFSWWGAYFNENKDKQVYYPSVWFGPAQGEKNMKDLFPDGWMRVMC